MIQGMFKLSVMGSGFSQGFTDVCACDAVKRTCSSGGCGGGDVFRSMGGIGAMNKSMSGGGGPVIDWGNGGPAATGGVGGNQWADCMNNMISLCLGSPGCIAMYILSSGWLIAAWAYNCALMPTKKPEEYMTN